MAYVKRIGIENHEKESVKAAIEQFVCPNHKISNTCNIACPLYKCCTTDTINSEDVLELGANILKSRGFLRLRSMADDMFEIRIAKLVFED